MRQMVRRLLRRRLNRTTAISLVCIGLLAGIGAGKYWGFYVGWLLLLCFVAVIFFAWKRRLILVPLAMLASFAIGGAQAHAHAQANEPYQNLMGKPVVVTGTVSEDPTFSDKGRRQFYLSDIVLKGAAEKALPGQLFISTPLSSDVRRHDIVEARGTLREGFGQFQGSIYFAEVEKTGEAQHMIDDVRAGFASAVTSVLPEPQASLGLGFVIGMKSALPETLEDALRDLSLTHIVVASGYNLTILVRAAKRLREKKSKLQTLLLSFALVALFLFVTGNSPSMVRAAAVSGLALLAWYYGRQFKPHALLLIVMAATALYNPVYLWGDLGWWLSFAAFAGIMIVSPLIIERFWGKGQPSFLGQIAIEALVAQLMTLPIIMLVFGNVSLLGVVANVLVVPLVPFAMLAVAVAGFAAMLVPVVAAFVAVPAQAVLSLIVSIINLLERVPNATHQVYIDMTGLVIAYLVIAIITAILWSRLSRERKRRALMQQIV